VRTRTVPASAYRLAKLPHAPEPDFGAVIARLKRITECSGPLLAGALKIPERRLNAIEMGKPATWSEGDVLLRALQACGNNLDGLTR
jgi:hypothetical protein